MRSLLKTHCIQKKTKGITKAEGKTEDKTQGIPNSWGKGRWIETHKEDRGEPTRKVRGKPGKCGDLEAKGGKKKLQEGTSVTSQLCSLIDSIKTVKQSLNFYKEGVHWQGSNIHAVEWNKNTKEKQRSQIIWFLRQRWKSSSLQEENWV